MGNRRLFSCDKVHTVLTKELGDSKKQVVKRIVEKLRMYHNVRADAPERLPLRIRYLEQLRRYMADQRLSSKSWQALAGRVQDRLDYLKTLNSFLHGRRHKVRRVLQVASDTDADKDLFPRRTRRKGDDLYIRMKSDYLTEKVDPLCRAGDATTGILAKFFDWRKAELKKHPEFANRPAYALVKFFLLRDTGRLKFPTTRPHATREIEHNLPQFANGDGYCDYVTNHGGLFEKYLPLKHDPQGLAFDTQKFDTVDRASYSNPPPQTTGRQQKCIEMKRAYLYVMRNNQISAYPEQITLSGSTQRSRHSEGFQQKRVQAGGTIVASDGKILAIDNPVVA
jgi:hypothetical protein